MPEFTRHPFKLVTQPGGTNLVLPPDQIPEGQYQYIKNLRPYLKGGFFTRPGVTSIHTAISGATYLHSLLRFNDYNPASTVGSCRYIGDDQGKVYVCDTGNPITTTHTATTGFSGNPLSMIPFRPTNAPNAGLYIGDSAKMAMLFFRPADTIAGGPAVYQMGVPPPNGVSPNSTDVIPTAGGAGLLVGTYWWRFIWRNKYTGARSNPGQASRVNITPDPVYGGLGLAGGLLLASQSASMTVPVLTAGGGGVSADFTLDVYRFGGTIFDWRYVSSIDPAVTTTFNDNFSDQDILSAPGIPLDAVGDFALTQPFAISDIYRNTGSITFTQPGGAGTAYLATFSSGITPTGVWFGYLPGTPITLNGNVTLHTYGFPVTTTTVFMQEDITTYGLAAATPYSFEIYSATSAGQPLQFLFGPYGSGSSGLFLFAVGDVYNPGTLYWTNGNDPDSASLTNSLEITDPTDALVNGIVYDGRVFVWSTKQMFEVVPDPNIAGNFLARKIPGAGGLYAPWGIADCGEFMAYIGQDGIYASQGVGSTSLTDSLLYPFFPHDANPGQDFLMPNTDTLMHPHPSFLNYWRLSWQDGYLYFDYPEYHAPDGGGNPVAGKNKAWVRGTRGTWSPGWFLDVYHQDGPISRASENSVIISSSPPVGGVSDKMVGIGGALYLLTGVTDASSAIDFALVTAAWDCGDSRANKWLGDMMIEAKPNGETVTAQILGTNNTLAIGSSTTLTASGGFMGFTLINLNLMNRTIGVMITGSASAGTPELYEWHPSYVPKPERTTKRATDWTDDGKKGAKYVRGFVLEGDTASTSGTDIVVDATNLSKVTSASHGAFGSGDVGSHLSIYGANFQSGVFVILSVSGGAAILDHPASLVGGTSGGSWFLGTPKTVHLESDGGILQATLVISHPGQTEYCYTFSPFVAAEMRIFPVDVTQDWSDYGIRWIWDDYPEFATLVEDFTHLPTPQYIRGFELEVDTQSAVVSFQIQTDLGNVVATPTVQTSTRDIYVYGFNPPVIASEFRLYPLGSWRKFNLRLISDSYPDFGRIYSPIQAISGGKCSYVRGLRLKADTNNAAIQMQILGDGGSLMRTLTIQHNGQEIIPYAFNPPFIAYMVQLVPSTVWRLWPDGMDWDADIYPDLTTEQSPIMNLGTPDAKFLQGMKLTADTTGVAPASFEIHGDGGVLMVTLPATAFNGKSVVAFPVGAEWPPFIAHDVYIVPKTPARMFLDETKWVFEPSPELAGQYKTPQITADFKSWWHASYMWIAYVSTSTLTITLTKDGGDEVYTLPSTSGAYSRVPFRVKPTKSKSVVFNFTSPQPFRLYLQDSFIQAKEWGRPYDAFTPVHVFGESSVVSGAKI